MHPVLFHIGRILIPSYGAVAALGVLLALALGQKTARMAQVDPVKVWNLCVLSVCSALAASRLLLVATNWSALRVHPTWLLALAMVHHPLLAGTGTLAGAACAAWYVRRSRLPFAATADALAAPLALGLAFEQAGELLAGSGYGIEASVHFPWAITYSNPLAALWSNTPLGIPLYPVQVYAAAAFLAIAVLLFVWLPLKRRRGDAAGLCLMSCGVAIYVTEIWRDQEGRGAVLHGSLDWPQVAAVAMVLAGAVVLREHKDAAHNEDLQPHESLSTERQGTA